MDPDLSGRVVAVTGASSGIGEATALACAEAGAAVSLAARRTERIEELAKRIEDGGGRALATTEDVDVDHPAPFLGRRVGDRPEQHHARVVDERVEPAQLGGRALDERARLVLLAHVGGGRERAAARLLDPLRELLDALGAARGERDGAPASAQASAVASPIPDEAPVIATTRPLRRVDVHAPSLSSAGSSARTSGLR